MFCGDLAKLQIRSRRDVGIATRVSFRKIRQASELVRLHFTAGEAEAAHIGVLRGSDVKQSAELVEQDVGPFGILAVLSIGLHLVPHRERIFLAFRLLLGAESSSFSDEAVLRRNIRSQRIGWPRSAELNNLCLSRF